MPVETFIESSVTIRVRLRDATDAEEIASRCHDLRELLAFDTLHQPDRTDVEVERTKPRIVRKRASPLVVRSDDEVARGASPVETEPGPFLNPSDAPKMVNPPRHPAERSGNSSEARKATEGASTPVQQSQDGTETETHYSDGFPKIPAGVKRKA